MFTPFLSLLLMGGLLLVMAGAARAEYPDKQFTFVVPFAAGSATDQLARALGVEVPNAP